MTNRIKLLTTVFFAFFLSYSHAVVAQQTINWMTWEEAVAKNKIEKKKIFVDVYTEWCGWCKKIDAQTFHDPNIVAYMNANYYSVKFDAEQKEDIVFRDRVFKYVKNGRKGYNELAVELLMGKLSYPTIVFLDENIDIIQPIPGFRTVEEFEMMMEYFSDNYYKTTAWKSFVHEYTKKKEGNKYAQPVKYNKN